MKGVASALLAAIVASVGPAAAESPEAKGLRIAVEAQERDNGFDAYTADGNMILRDRQGTESVRAFRVKTLEVVGDGDKSLMVFDRPKDIRNTALLTYSHKLSDDDQWLYLPALRRVKRISSSNQSGSFVGSEFAYEDLVSQEVEKYTFNWLRDEPCPGVEELECHVNERQPKSQKSGYSRQLVWLDRSEYRVYRIEYFDRKNALVKTLSVADYRQYKARYWRADRMSMVNHQNGKSTMMLWRDYDFSAELDADDFTKRALERLS